jgi:hypothetical protein
LCQAYANDAAVTDELVDAILKPGLQVGVVVGGRAGAVAHPGVAWELPAGWLFGPDTQTQKPLLLCLSILLPAMQKKNQPGAVDVFLDFISYSGGPLPEQLLEQVGSSVEVLKGSFRLWGF